MAWGSASHHWEEDEEEEVPAAPAQEPPETEPTSSVDPDCQHEWEISYSWTNEDGILIVVEHCAKCGDPR